MKYLITFDDEMQKYTNTPYTYIDLAMDEQDAWDYIRQQLYGELPIDPQIIYNGVTVQVMAVHPMKQKTYGLTTCNHCGAMFVKYQKNEKYCCFQCAELGRKDGLKARQDKYLANEQNRAKHLIRLKTHYRMRAEQPTVCEQCGTRGRLHFHHFIYSDECITIGKWLCPKCHKAEHTRIEADE